jgi:NAD(P)-dependent dehydrogenase (short-subunit alcohol dehydrogenase family)
MVKLLAAELEKTRIRVNAIDPGPTLTALRKRAFPGEDNAALKSPDSLMPLYLWAMGPDGADSNGETLAWTP